MLLDGSTVNVGIAYLAGLASFFAPCVLPLLPVYIGYFAGVGIGDDEISERRGLIFKYSLLFSFGFILVFVLLGLSASRVGLVLAAYKDVISMVGGALMFLLGLYLLGVFKVAVLYKEFKIDFKKHITKYKSVNSFILGLTFGFAWTPCIGPVLAVILYWASQSGGVYNGAFLLTSFGLGIASPFILFGLFIDKALPIIGKTRMLQRVVHVGSGLLILLFGVLLLVDKVDVISSFLVRIIH